MAAPTAPTATTIVTEAYNRYGITSPTAAQLARGVNYGLEYVKDLMCLSSRRWKTLRTSVCMTLAPNFSAQTDYWGDFEEMISIDVWEPLDPETAFGNDSSTHAQWILTNETKTSEEMVGQYFVAYAQQSDTPPIATGIQFCRLVQCISYNPTTKYFSFIDTVYGSIWAPTSVYVYRRLANKYPITVQKHSDYSRDNYFPQTKQRPTQAYISNYTYADFSPFTNSLIEPMIQYNYTADKTYFTVWNYYMDLQRVDLSSARYEAILRRWKSILTQGVYMWLLDDNTDDRMDRAEKKFGTMLTILRGQDIDGYDVSDIQRRSED